MYAGTHCIVPRLHIQGRGGRRRGWELLRISYVLMWCNKFTYWVVLSAWKFRLFWSGGLYGRMGWSRDLITCNFPLGWGPDLAYPQCCKLWVGAKGFPFCIFFLSPNCTEGNLDSHFLESFPGASICFSLLLIWNMSSTITVTQTMSMTVITTLLVSIPLTCFSSHLAPAYPDTPHGVHLVQLQPHY